MKAGKPSLTARSVALTRSLLSRPQTPEGDPEAENRLYAQLQPVVGWAPVVRWRRWMPGRTEFFDDEVLQAVRSGITQVVIVGAGYDGRALRFRHPGVHFFEMDHPATQADKRRRMEALGVPLDHVSFVPVDLMREGSGAALSAAGHSLASSSLFLCEGLFMYLSNPAVEHLLGDLAARAPGGSRLALSAREVAPGAPPIAKARDAAGRLILAWIGEPRRSAFGFGETTVLLERTGWKVVRVIEQASLRGPQPRRKGLLLAAEPS